MWQCDNCGYTDEDGSTFEEEIDEENPEQVVHYCPECGSDEVYQVDADDDEEDDDEELDEAEEEEDDEDWDEDEDDYEDDDLDEDESW
jgi:segregation and condensation protein B